MALFNFELSLSDRALLEVHRIRMGARSSADALRYLIRGWNGPAAAEVEALPDVRDQAPIPPTKVRVAAKSAARSVQFGPKAAEPGSRLKKR
jgi:hypothetical protein